jgi:hypothetical protein
MLIYQLWAMWSHCKKVAYTHDQESKYMQDQHEFLDDWQSRSPIAIAKMHHSGNKPDEERVLPTSSVVASGIQLD